MTTQFLRDYELEWWDRSETEVPFNKNGLGKQLTALFESAGYDFDATPTLLYDRAVPQWNTVRALPTDVYKVKGLHIEASINLRKSSTSSDSKPQEITIFGLSEKLIETFSTGTKLILKAGYKTSGIGLIFQGEVTEVKVTREGSTNKVTLICSSDLDTKKNLYLSKSWDNRTSYEEILAEILSFLRANGVAAKNTVTPRYGTPSLSTLYPAGGLSVQGNAFKILDKICGMEVVNYRAYTVNGNLYIEPRDYPRLRNLIKVTENDLIGKITPTSDNKEQINGIQLKTLLDSRITPATVIEIDSGVGIDRYVGEWSITNVNHKLSYEGKEWVTIIEASLIKGDSYNIEEYENYSRASLSKEF